MTICSTRLASGAKDVTQITFSQNNLLQNNSLQFALDVITNCVYLQILQNAAALITKCVSWIYYKMLHPLLHNAQIITKCCRSYYKMHNLLQNALLLQNAAEQGCLTVESQCRRHVKPLRSLFFGNGFERKPNPFGYTSYMS